MSFYYNKKVITLISWETKDIQEEITLLKENAHYVVLDLETTGLSPKKGGRIIEIAAVRVINGKIVDVFHTLVNPQLKIPPKITNITNISNEDVADKPTILEVLPKLYRFIGDSVIVAHNASFDWERFLVDGFKQVGIYPSNEVFCTLKFFKKIAPNRGRGGYTLDQMCNILNVPLENHHQALDDTKSTAKCLIKFLHIFAPNSLTESKSIEVKENEIKHTPVKIKQVRYWEKKKNKREMFRRQYVRISTGKEWGTVFFDIPTQTWGNKDFPLPVDFNKIEKSVLEFLNLKTRVDLMNFRN